jgi:hypothetical protein
MLKCVKKTRKEKKVKSKICTVSVQKCFQNGLHYRIVNTRAKSSNSSTKKAIAAFSLKA